IHLPLETEGYDIYCGTSIQVRNEPWIPQLISHSVSDRENSFHNGIYNHDWKCIISGIFIPEIFIQANNCTALKAVQIFPPEHESL
ncbi:hypothetical protein L873DRAFT_1694020, partial [Choiromyces venosus 120613-1]